MHIKLMAFGVVREIVGSGIVTMAVDQETDAAEVKRRLEMMYPRLKELKAFAIAVNGEYATTTTIVKPGDEVAVIPPVSGG